MTPTVTFMFNTFMAEISPVGEAGSESGALVIASMYIYATSGVI